MAGVSRDALTEESLSSSDASEAKQEGKKERKMGRRQGPLPSYL